MGLDVFLITDYTSTWYHIHLFASSAWLDFDTQRFLCFGAFLSVCMRAVDVNVVGIPGIMCKCVSLAKEAELVYV